MKPLYIRIKDLKKIRFKRWENQNMVQRQNIVHGIKAALLLPRKDKQPSEIVFNTKQRGKLKVTSHIVSYTKEFLMIEKGSLIPLNCIIKIEA